MRWPFVLRAHYEGMCEYANSVHRARMDAMRRVLRLEGEKQHLIAEAAALRNLLANASKNDHRDPVTGQFIKAPKGNA